MAGTADDDLQARVAELEREVDRLTAIEAITNLIADYGRAADSGQHDRFVELFTEDGSIELHGGESSGTYPPVVAWQGHEELRRFITDPDVHLAIEGRCMHLPTTSLTVTVDGDSATATSNALVLLVSDDGISIFGAGFTRWSLRLVDGEWRIQRRLRHQIGAPPQVLAELLRAGR